MSKKTLLDIAYTRDFPALEDAWMTHLSPVPTDHVQREEMYALVRWLRKVHEDELGILFATTLVEAMEEQMPGEACYAGVCTLWELFPGNAELRTAYARQRCHVDSDNPALPAILKCSGIYAAVAREKCLDYIEARAALAPGSGAIHIRQRFPVMIVSFSPEDDMVTLRDTTREYTTPLATFNEQYHMLLPDDVRFIRAFSPDTLAEELRAEPAKTVQRFLRCVGGSASFRECKDFFVTDVFTLEDWKAWWRDAHARIANDPWISCSEGTQPTLRVRDTPEDKTHILQAQFDLAGHIHRQVSLAYSYAHDFEGGLIDDVDVLRYCYAQCKEGMGEGGVADLWRWLACLRLASLLGEECGAYSSAWLSSAADRIACAQWCGWSLQLCEALITALHTHDARWAELCAAMLPYAPLPYITRCETLLSQENPDALRAAWAKVKPDDVMMAEAFCVVWLRMAKGQDITCAVPLTLHDATLHMCDLMEKLQRPSEEDGQNFHSGLCAVRATLSSDKYHVIRDVFRQCGLESAPIFFKKLHTNSGLSSMMKAHIVPLLSAAQEEGK